MRISIHEFAALFSLLVVGYAAGWCFKGLWDKELKERKNDINAVSGDRWKEE